jgi:hypothetical protein
VTRARSRCPAYCSDATSNPGSNVSCPAISARPSGARR